MFEYKDVPLLVTALFFGIVSTIILLIIRAKYKKSNVTKEFLEQVKLMKYEAGYSLDDQSGGPFKMWENNFGRKLIRADMMPENSSPGKVSLVIFIISLVAYLVLSAVFGNFGIGIIPVLIFLVVIQIVANKKVQTKQEIYDDQIPSFLSLLKSNVQSGESSENALMKAIENTSVPLYDDLKIALAMSQTGSFESAIRALRSKTNDETLQFLCGCIELSSKVGTDLESQITIIEGILENKRALKRKLSVAIAENTPLLYVSAGLIPFVFLFTYLTNTQAREYWFKTVESWAVFIGVGIVYGFGVFMTNRIIQKTGRF